MIGAFNWEQQRQFNKQRHFAKQEIAHHSRVEGQKLSSLLSRRTLTTGAQSLTTPTVAA